MGQYLDTLSLKNINFVALFCLRYGVEDSLLVWRSTGTVALKRTLGSVISILKWWMEETQTKQKLRKNWRKLQRLKIKSQARKRCLYTEILLRRTKNWWVQWFNYVNPSYLNWLISKNINIVFKVFILTSRYVEWRFFKALRFILDNILSVHA